MEMPEKPIFATKRNLVDQMSTLSYKKLVANSRGGHLPLSTVILGLTEIRNVNGRFPEFRCWIEIGPKL
jgi:hypothetical protein